MSKDEDFGNGWIGFIVILVIWFIIHNIRIGIEDTMKNPPPPAQTINSIKVSDIRVGGDLIDKLFRVVNLRGTAENISPYLKSNIVIKVELQDRNGVNIGTEEIKITSLAPSEKYKIDENVWNKEVKSYKVKSITTKSQSSMFKKHIIFLILLISAIITIPVLCQIFVLNQNGNNLLPEKEKLRESDYVNAYCKGTKEYVLPDKTRIDCLTEQYACEFDWAKKWYEGFGQALWYAHNSGKKPCLVLILKTQKDYIYFDRAKILCDKYNVHLIDIKSKNFQDSTK